MARNDLRAQSAIDDGRCFFVFSTLDTTLLLWVEQWRAHGNNFPGSVWILCGGRGGRSADWRAGHTQLCLVRCMIDDGLVGGRRLFEYDRRTRTMAAACRRIRTRLLQLYVLLLLLLLLWMRLLHMHGHLMVMTRMSKCMSGHGVVWHAGHWTLIAARRCDYVTGRRCDHCAAWHCLEMIDLGVHRWLDKVFVGGRIDAGCADAWLTDHGTAAAATSVIPWHRYGQFGVVQFVGLYCERLRWTWRRAWTTGWWMKERKKNRSV